MSDVKWIKIVTDIFDDEKIQLIEAMPEADSIIVIWFKILCLAGKQNNGGVLMLNDKIPFTDEMLSTIFRRSIQVIRMALRTFSDLGMVEIVSGAVTIPNWEKHQSLGALETAREKTRIRVAEHRKKQKLLADGCNVTETLRNATDKKREDKKREEVDKNIDDFEKAIRDFIEHRKKLKKPMTEHAVDLLRKELEKLAPGNKAEQISLIEYAIKKAWLGVYPKNEYGNGGKKPEKKSAPTDADYEHSSSGYEIL